MSIPLPRLILWACMTRIGHSNGWQAHQSAMHACDNHGNDRVSTAHGMCGSELKKRATDGQNKAEVKKFIVIIVIIIIIITFMKRSNRTWR